MGAMRACAVLFALVAAQVDAAPITVYSNDFDSPATVGPGVTALLAGGNVVSSQGYNGVGGFSGNFLQNATVGPIVSTQLGLSGLPAHTSLDVNLLVALIDSWDGLDGSPAPDYFNVMIDGVTVLQAWCNLASGSSCYPGTIAATRAARGFTNGDPYFNSDIGFNLTGEGVLSVPHTGSAALIQFFASGAGWQGGTDESWAIENLSVVVDTTAGSVPEPATTALLGLGLAGAIARQRQRRRRQAR